jgi:hypothetical protein
MSDDRFDDWLRELDEEVIQGEYGYEENEFTVYADLWRPAFGAGQTPREAFDRSLKAFDDDRKARREEQARRYAEIISSEAAIAKSRGQS